MSYKQIKWLIIIIPTLTIGLWEYVRHEFLLSYVSMELGNWLAPVIVFSVTVVFLTKLFSILEAIQEELNEAKLVKASLEEREKIARELHDGIAQSLFLMSVQVDQLDKQHADDQPYRSLRRTVHQVNEYVRQAIANLRYPPNPVLLPWMESLRNLIHDFSAETEIKIELNWTLPEVRLSAKEKVELYAAVRESLLNIRKHTQATEVWIQGNETPQGWICQVIDNGEGFARHPFDYDNHYGLKIMKERAKDLGWQLQLIRKENKTIVEIRKEEF